MLQRNLTVLFAMPFIVISTSSFANVIGPPVPWVETGNFYLNLTSDFSDKNFIYDDNANNQSRASITRWYLSANYRFCNEAQIELRGGLGKIKDEPFEGNYKPTFGASIKTGFAWQFLALGGGFLFSQTYSSYTDKNISFSEVDAFMGIATLPFKTSGELSILPYISFDLNAAKGRADNQTLFSRDNFGLVYGLMLGFSEKVWGGVEVRNVHETSFSFTLGYVF